MLAHTSGRIFPPTRNYASILNPREYFPPFCLPVLVHHNSNHPSSPYHHMQAHTMVEAYHLTRGQDRILNPRKLTENQTEVSYPTRSQISIWIPEPDQRPYIHTRNSVTNSGRNFLLDQIPSRPLEVQPSTLAETLYSIKDHKIQKIREEREHSPNKDYLEIGTWTYSHSKSRSLNVSVRTQTTEAKGTCHYSDISLQQAMNTATQWKHEKMILKSALWWW